MRVDGGTPIGAQVEADIAMCKGEAAKFGVTDINNARIAVIPAIKNDQDRRTVFEGCMAQRGYIATR